MIPLDIQWYFKECVISVANKSVEKHSPIPTVSWTCLVILCMVLIILSHSSVAGSGHPASPVSYQHGFGGSGTYTSCGNGQPTPKTASLSSLISASWALLQRSLSLLSSQFSAPNSLSQTALT